MTGHLIKFVFCVFIFISSQASAQIVADRFDLKTNLDGSSLSLSIDTDLPDDVVVLVSVDREYWLTGEDAGPDAYAESYFSERASVGEWRETRVIELDNDAWEQKFEEEQERVQSYGFDMQADRISDQVIASARVYPAQQPEGQSREFSGQAVNTNAHGHQSIIDEVVFDYPISFVAQYRPSLDPNNLDVGQAYSVSRRTPLMAHHSPGEDVGGALRESHAITSGSVFTVLEHQNIRNVPWYKVMVVDTQTQQAITGWINSRALFGQELQVQ